MSRLTRSTILLLLAGALACSDQPGRTATEPALPAADAAPTLASHADPEHARLERLARRVALGLSDPAVRAELRSALDQSPFAEHKLQFQRLLHGTGGLVEALARASGEGERAILADADAAMTLELYFPVPAHRAAWSGDADLLVATEVADHEIPVAFDPGGRRHLLDPDQPPATPVLALVPAETDFDAPPRPAFQTCIDCSPEPSYYSTSITPGLYLTHAQFGGDYEGWLKGSPEFEIHIMGPASTTDTTDLTSFQCIGEHAPVGYQWDMNQLTWNGSQLLFSASQMDAFASRYPGQSYLVFAVEDDDTACGIKTDSNRGADLLKALGQAYADYKGAKDQKVFTSGGAVRILKAAKSGAGLLSALANFIKTNDDVIGFAISDAVSGRYRSGSNWTVQDQNLVSTGWFQLEMK